MNNWSSYHVLIVEDDILSFTLLADLLEPTGIRITHAATGLEAVRFCKKDNSINLVLMDMRLPELDGYQATKLIKETRKELPVIAQTAHALSEDRNKCLAAGCDDYLKKPIFQNALFTMISKYLNEAA
jgi:CheY-like chemotaxis protein